MTLKNLGSSVRARIHNKAKAASLKCLKTYAPLRLRMELTLTPKVSMHKRYEKMPICS